MLTISDSDYNRILTIIGYPVVSVSDLGENITDSFIKDTLILPVLTDIYSIYFPIKTYSQYNVSSSIDIDFPNDETFGIIDARLNTRKETGMVRVANPIINEINIKHGGRSQHMWGTENDYGYTAYKRIQKLESDSTITDNKAFKVRVNATERKLEGYSNTYGQLSVTWADYTEDWDDIQKRFKNDAIKLAQAIIMEYFGLLREQSVNDLPSELSGTEFLSRSESYREEVLEKWNNFSKVVIIR